MPGVGRAGRLAAAGMGVLLLAACATYHARPLPDAPDLKAGVDRLSVPAATLALPGLTPVAFNAGDGLDGTELAMLAVSNNPALVAARGRLGVVRAEAFAAGLLPDPQLDLGVDHPAPSGPGLVNGGIAALSFAVNALLTRGPEADAARQRVRQVHLELLWQEWQTAQRARQLYVQGLAQQRLRDLLARNRRLLAAQSRAARAALARGDVDVAAEGATLAALTDIDARLRQVDESANRTRAALNALLGLAPAVVLKLQPRAGTESGPSESSFRAALHELASRRPDLLALRAGYASQDAQLRRAIRAQFPLVSVGINRQRDTGDVNSSGLSISLNLPLFNGNRGAIRVARATREQLRAEYQARLDQSRSQAVTLFRTRALLEHQLAQLADQLPDLVRAARAAHQAWQRGEMHAGDYLAIEQRALDRQEERVRLRADVAMSRIALDTLLGRPLSGDHARGDG
jgi:outer membrane protein TolC